MSQNETIIKKYKELMDKLTKPGEALHSLLKIYSFDEIVKALKWLESQQKETDKIILDMQNKMC